MEPMAKLGQVQDVDLKLLRCFCVIVEEGSFSAAQSTLNISQSALSEYLRSLELRLGVRLCQRGPKGFRLYPAGEAVYEAARELFNSVDAFKKRTADLCQGAGYELSIGIQDGIIEHPRSRIVEAIEQFGEYYPGVHLKVEIMLGFQLRGRVADGGIDVGVGIVNDKFRRLTFDHLFDERAYIYCGRRHPLFTVPDSELTREHIEASSYCHRGQVEFIHPDPSDGFPHRGDTAHGAIAHLALILSGRNLGYLPDHIAESHVAEGRLRTLRPDAFEQTFPVAAIIAPSSGEFRLLRSFVDCLVDSQMATACSSAPEVLRSRSAR
jgi:DNA-binding transcriptional LysR family regulator